MSIIGSPVSLGHIGHYASIEVTADTGSTITCTTPLGLILTATEVSGKWLFDRLDKYGNYIVSNGTITSTVNVSSSVLYTVLLKYELMNYIQATGTQCATTGIYPSLNTVIKFGINMSEATGDCIIGHREANSESDESDYRIFNYSSNIYFDAGNTRLNGSAMSAGTYYDIEIGNHYVKRNGTTVLSGTTLTSLNSGDTAPINIFSMKSTSTTGCKGKLYYLQIIKNGETVFDGKPYSFNNKGFLYDSIQQRSIYSRTGTDFLYG